MTTEEITKMEEWCDWACGNCSRTHVKWKAARLGYIRGVHDTEQKLNKHNVMWRSELLLAFCKEYHQKFDFTRADDAQPLIDAFLSKQ